MHRIFDMFVPVQANTGAGSLAANSVGAAGGAGGGAVGGAIPARGRRLQQGGPGHDGPGKDGKNNSPPSSPSGNGKLSPAT